MMTVRPIDRAAVHRAVDRLQADDLSELASFIAYLEYRSQASGKDWFEKVYDLLAPVRETVQTSGMSEDEVDQAIDEALTAVRYERRA